MFMLIISIVGMAMTGILFYHFPRLPRVYDNTGDVPGVSVIIPARNEAKNLPLILEDLKQQTISLVDIICVDDSSNDDTAAVALDHGAFVIELKEKPAQWMGKSWACQCGAAQARGELLLFMDADVRLGHQAIEALVRQQMVRQAVISVQPYHHTRRLYEQLSLFFNLVLIGANGAALPQQRAIGLFGPIILMERRVYWQIGGHASVRHCIAEDVSLGDILKAGNIPFQLFIGNPDIRFRMYAGGIGDLIHGWTKNMATGASKTPIFRGMMVFCWISSLIAVPMALYNFLAAGQLGFVSLFLTLYILWVVLLKGLSKEIGNFRFWSILLYPIPLLVFLMIFMVSLIKKIFGLQVHWKGRSMGTR
ncbi:glycosyltransferase [Eubacterium sp.]|uniref:glycosyltransferase n=1 Tax=Eubacterium sp. TaxID=142586 RepID=UPI002FC87D47